jgi:hypothetical protein
MRLNGWQRLWLVGTVCLGLWLMGSWPLYMLQDSGSEQSYRWAIEKDFKNPQCKPYQTAPISSLTEPPFSGPNGGSCWHIYTSRLYDAEVPYTLEAYTRNRDARWWTFYFQGLAIGTGATILLSAFAYLCGWVVGWVYRGFRRA